MAFTKQPKLKAYPITVAATTRGRDSLGPKAKPKTQNEKTNSKQTTQSGSPQSTSYYQGGEILGPKAKTKTQNAKTNSKGRERGAKTNLR